MGKAAGALRKIVVGKKGSSPAELADLEKVIAGKKADTDWYEDPTMGWRHEVDDAGYKWDQKAFEAAPTGTGPGAFGKSVKHPEMLRRYGERMQDDVGRGYAPIGELPLSMGAPGTGGAYTPSRDSIKLASDLGRKKRAAIHEGQHAIQQREGWLNKSEYANPSMGEEDFWRYLRSPAEREARLVEIRKDWTPAERKAYPMKKMMEDELERLDARKAAGHNAGSSSYPSALSVARQSGGKIDEDYSLRALLDD
jgi:hypothetical protein